MTASQSPVIRRSSARSRLLRGYQPETALRLQTVLLFMVIIVSCRTGDSTPSQPSILGQEYATRFPLGTIVAGSCNIIVVTYTSCGPGKSLAVNWGADVRHVVDSSTVDVTTTWLIFDDLQDSTYVARYYGDVGKYYVMPGDEDDINNAIGMGGTPHTLLVNADGRVVFHGRGNFLPVAESIRRYCHAPVVQ